MDAWDLPVTCGADAARLVRALGQHRYVAGRLHLVHAFVFHALDPAPELDAARAWACAVMAEPSIDRASKDERLWRPSTEAELAAALAAFWSPPGDARDRVHARLRDALGAAEIDVAADAPFDESREEDLFPVLVDAGWELLPLAQLEAERHKGAILAFGEPILFAAAKFEEENAGERSAYLQELPALGPVELLDAMRGDALAEGLALWTSGPAAYHDYVLRGVLRAAKLTP